MCLSILGGEGGVRSIHPILKQAETLVLFNISHSPNFNYLQVHRQNTTHENTKLATSTSQVALSRIQSLTMDAPPRTIIMRQNDLSDDEDLTIASSSQCVTELQRLQPATFGTSTGSHIHVLQWDDSLGAWKDVVFGDGISSLEGSLQTLAMGKLKKDGAIGGKLKTCTNSTRLHVICPNNIHTQDQLLTFEVITQLLRQPFTNSPNFPSKSDK